MNAFVLWMRGGERRGTTRLNASDVWTRGPLGDVIYNCYWVRFLAGSIRWSNGLVSISLEILIGRQFNTTHDEAALWIYHPSEFSAADASPRGSILALF